MAHVQIQPKDSGGYTLMVDGVDIGSAVLHDGFSIVPAGGHPMSWEVHLRLAATSVDFDLPDSIVMAERAEVEG